MPQPQINCNQCWKNYNSNTELEQYTNNVHNKEYYKCKTSDYTFNILYNMEEHQYEHIGSDNTRLNSTWLMKMSMSSESYEHFEFDMSQEEIKWKNLKLKIV